MPERMSDRLSEYMSGIPGRMSEYMSGKMPGRMSA